VSLNLDPEGPNYEATSDPSLRSPVRPQESGYVGGIYLDALMMSLYENSHIEAALNRISNLEHWQDSLNRACRWFILRDATLTMVTTLRPKMTSSSLSFTVTLWSTKSSQHQRSYKQWTWLTKLIEGKSKKGKPLCTVRIQDLRFERSITMPNVRGVISSAHFQISSLHRIRPGEVIPTEASARLVNRAIHFHWVITVYRRTSNSDL
jgi:hypothetical protein